MTPTLRCITSATNSGTSATRSPNADQPVAKFDSSADRYARTRSASRIVTVARVGGGGAASAEFRRLKNSTTATPSSATPYTTNGAVNPQPAARPPTAGPPTAPIINEVVNRPAIRPRASGRANVDHQSQRRDIKHGRADAAEKAEKQQLPISLGKRAGGRRHGHDQQTADIDASLTQPLGQ